MQITCIPKIFLSLSVVSVSPVVKMIMLVSLFTCISACSTAPEKDAAPKRSPAELANVPDAVPRDEPRSELGNMKTYEVFGKRYFVLDSSDGFTQEGIASWYGPKFHGKKTSSGEVYDMYAMTAAPQDTAIAHLPGSEKPGKRQKNHRAGQ